MTLTYDEKLRLKNAEETAQQLKTLLEGALSENALKQLRVLSLEQLRRVEARLDAVEIQVQSLLELVRKLQ